MGKGAEEGLYLARAGRKFLVNFTYHIEESNLGWGVGGGDNWSRLTKICSSYSYGHTEKKWFRTFKKNQKFDFLILTATIFMEYTAHLE